MERSIFVAECASLEEIFGLPSVSYDDRADLPSYPGIYFLIAHNPLHRIAYIGSSVNLYSRWCSHHRMPEANLLRLFGVDVRIHFAVFPPGTKAKDLALREAILQRRFSPVLDKVPVLADQVRLLTDKIDQLAGAIEYPLSEYTTEELRQLLEMASYPDTELLSHYEAKKAIKKILGDLYDTRRLRSRWEAVRKAPARRIELCGDEDFATIIRLAREQIDDLEDMTIRQLQLIGRNLKVYRTNHLAKTDLVAKIKIALQEIPAN